MHVHPFSDKRKALQKNEAVELEGMIYYPLLVEDYEIWQACKPVLLLRQGTLPVQYAVLPYLECVWAMSYDAAISRMMQGPEAGGGEWPALMKILFLSLRLSDKDEIVPLGKVSNQRALTAIQIKQGDRTYQITSAQFQQVRELIAELNGETLPDEADNPDLIQAQEDMNAANAVPLNTELNDLLASVASERRIRKSELFEWTIKEFEEEVRSISRRYGYLVAAIVEANGGKYKEGNPTPSWCFDREKSDTAGLISMDALQKAHNAAISTDQNAPNTPSIS